ncbi:monooxygenase family protein [Acidocella facilis]|uniref:monooxygenase family protein n=1 Tax=Acidocella facilis TaxID=525 RepID=UPI00047EEA5B|nr:DUF4188 domain-containing protein [Acidocella facilis]
MASKRVSVDLSTIPELVVVYLGMRVRSLRGVATLARLGPQIQRAVAAQPDGLLAHEFMLFGALHVGMRQYWRDMDSLEAFTRTGAHAGWWRDFIKDPAGTGFWHEAYRKTGGMEGIYLDMPAPLGLQKIAPPQAVEGAYKSSRGRMG